MSSHPELVERETPTVLKIRNGDSITYVIQGFCLKGLGEPKVYVVCECMPNAKKWYIQRATRDIYIQRDESGAVIESESSSPPSPLVVDIIKHFEFSEYNKREEQDHKKRREKELEEAEIRYLQEFAIRPHETKCEELDESEDSDEEEISEDAVRREMLELPREHVRRSHHSDKKVKSVKSSWKGNVLIIASAATMATFIAAIAFFSKW